MVVERVCECGKCVLIDTGIRINKPDVVGRVWVVFGETGECVGDSCVVAAAATGICWKAEKVCIKMFRDWDKALEGCC